MECLYAEIALDICKSGIGKLCRVTDKTFEMVVVVMMMMKRCFPVTTSLGLQQSRADVKWNKRKYSHNQTRTRIPAVMGTGFLWVTSAPIPVKHIPLNLPVSITSKHPILSSDWF